MSALPALGPGFRDPPHDAQGVFRAVMDALAHPATRRALVTDISPPRPLTAELAAIALALCDGDAPIWLDAALASAPAVAAWLRFHTGAPIVAEPSEASFAFVLDAGAMPALHAFAIGTEEFPDRSTTLVLAVQDFAGDADLSFEGPGIRTRQRLAPTPLPNDFAKAFAANRALFPRGVDLLFAGGGEVAGLPRSARLVEDS